MKLHGNLSELTNDAGQNKRDQLAPEPVKTAKQNPKSHKDPTIRYVSTRLELPEELKQRIDMRFVSDQDFRKRGKNRFMIEAIEKAMNSLEDEE